MKVVRSKVIGYCFGVSNTIEKATECISMAREENLPCYSIGSLIHNKDVVEDSSLIPHRMANDNIAYSMADAIYNLWEERGFTLNPNDTTPCSYSEFYAKMVGQIATTGSVYKTMTDSLKGTVDSVESNRQAVIGVSSDEELVSLIKYQNAYNAASRYINTVSTMIDTLISSL